MKNHLWSFIIVPKGEEKREGEDIPIWTLRTSFTLSFNKERTNVSTVALVVRCTPCQFLNHCSRFKVTMSKLSRCNLASKALTKNMKEQDKLGRKKWKWKLSFNGRGKIKEYCKSIERIREMKGRNGERKKLKGKQSIPFAHWDLGNTLC